MQNSYKRIAELAHGNMERQTPIGTSPQCARRSIVAWGEENGFVQLGDADVKKIEECTAIYLVRNPNGRLPQSQKKNCD